MTTLEDPSTDLALPDKEKLRRDFAAIHEFQSLVHTQMVRDHDYGIIPGTQKPTLLKPGAEKIAKLMGLADKYDILKAEEDWPRGFFRFLIKCSLISARTGLVVSEGLGECNSMEGKYRWRWLFESQLPPVGFSKDGAVTRRIKTRNGMATQYRLENDDIYSQVNTLLKMAKKRALVDAALSAGRLSDLFTQDMEDQRETPDVDQAPEAPHETPVVITAPLPAVPIISTSVELWNFGLSLHKWKNKTDMLKALAGSGFIKVPDDALIADYQAAANELQRIAASMTTTATI